MTQHTEFDVQAIEHAEKVSALAILQDSVSRQHTFDDSEIKGWFINICGENLSLFYVYQRYYSEIFGDFINGDFIHKTEELTGDERKLQLLHLWSELRNFPDKYPQVLQSYKELIRTQFKNPTK